MYAELSHVDVESDVVSISIAGAGVIRMHALRGRDSVARIAARDGWCAYEAPLPRIVAALARRGRGTVIVVGANTGYYALLCAAHGRPVWAYEAHAWTAEALLRNVSASGLDDLVTVSAVAVADHVGTVLLHTPFPTTPDVECSHSLNGAFRENAESSRVPSTTLDHEWCAAGRPPVELLLVDVESADHLVLAGARDLIEAQRPAIVVEVLPESDLSALNEAIAEMRLVGARIDDQGVTRYRRLGAWALSQREHVFLPEERFSEITSALRREWLR
ncbi:MAG TPA: FkbM family methyltransferase [Frankiaceae bacterium]|nr:FkbM family methyltransferase [Frankiaceae bacterium]